MIQTLRDALRRLRRRPSFAVVAALSLGVGIGAVTGVFSLVNGLFFRAPPGVEAPDRMVSVEASVASHPNFRDLREGARPEVELAAFSDHLLGLETGDRTRQVLGLFVSPGYFRVLGTRPALGRLPEAAGGDEVSGTGVVLSHRAWTRHFAGDSTIIGEPVRVNGTPLTVLGVAQEGFHGSLAGFQFDLWMPFAAASSVTDRLDLESRAADRLELVGRMAPGIGVERARTSLQAAAAGLRREHPAVDGDLEVTVRSYTGLDDAVRGPALALSGVMLAVAVLVLLVATTNVMGLQLARNIAASRDLALRSALGGEPRHVAGLVVAETLVVAAAGGALGVVAVTVVGTSVRDLVPEFPVQLALDFPVDVRVLAVAVLATAAAGLGAGLLPGLRARRTSLSSLLGTRGGDDRGGLRGLGFAVAAQVAVSVVLLSVAGVFVATLAEAGLRDPEIRTKGVLVAPFLDLSAAGRSIEEAPRLYEDLLDRLGREPGVESVALTARVPLSFTGRTMEEVTVPGRRFSPEGEGMEVEVTAVTPGFFETLAVALVEGSGLSPERADGPLPEAVPNRLLAERLWGDRSPIGRRLTLGGSEVTVSGVSAGLRTEALGEGPGPHLYVDLRDFPDPRPALLVRARSTPVADRIRAAVAEVEPGLPAPQLQSLDSFLDVALVPQRLGARLGGSLGLLSLLLATVGLYAMVGFWVSRRTREIGVRMAVGADPGSVFRRVLGQGATLAAWGTAAGLLVAFGATRFVASAVRGVSPAGPAIFLGVAGVVAAAVLVATAVPARRAAAVDPVKTLGSE